MLNKLIFDKTKSTVTCVDENGREYAFFPVSFSYWAPHTPIENGTYEITNENDWALDYGHNVGDAFGTFWVALDRTNDKGFHGYGKGRTLTSGTYGCIRADNEIGEQICRAIDLAISQGATIKAVVTGDVDEEEAFCVGYDGKQ